ncbi:hypothetical protein H0H92_004577 [Tricholoma furcatifolium]|nr:hypothetical protein H0H92_004577 [Tricholoma furcatifolium]
MYPTCLKLDGVETNDVPEHSGIFADIYKGQWQGRDVCLKVIRRTRQIDMEHLTKVISKEAIMWSQLHHPHIVPFFGIHYFKNTLALVFPWMQNGDIRAYLARHKDSNRVTMAFDVAQGLKFLHENDIVHGDLKSLNVLVNDRGRLCVADFWLSTIPDKDFLTLTSYSSEVSREDVARWQAPELFNPDNEEPADTTKASDVYSWACVAYEIFAGKAPFSQIARETSIMSKVLKGRRPSRPTDASRSWSVWGLTHELWSLMESCWSADPTQRPMMALVAEQLGMALSQDVLVQREHVEDSSSEQLREMAGGREIELSVRVLESLLN